MSKLKIESDSPELTVLVFDGTDCDAMNKYKRIMAVEDAYSCIWDIEQKCREIRRYPDEKWTSEQAEFAYDIQEKICEIISEYKLDEYL